jgi:hypothetical protein
MKKMKLKVKDSAFAELLDIHKAAGGENAGESVSRRHRRRNGNPCREKGSEI